jgi:hypothetical protein
MVTSVLYIYYNLARVIVTKRVGFARGRAGGMGHGGCATKVFWKSPRSNKPNYFGILSFQPKIFRSKLFISKESNPKGWLFMFQV